MRWVVPTAAQWLLIIGAGLFGVTGQLVMTYSYRYAPASTIAPLDYTNMIMSVILGYVFFAEIPSASVWIGAPLVVAGDFNAGTGTTEINNMLTGYVDGWAKAKSLGVTTNYSGNCDGCTRNSRIDYMFISKEASALVLKKMEIVDTRNASGVMASDHKPMIATFEVK